MFDSSAYPQRNGVVQLTLDNFEKDFGDRHLVHGCVEKFARETPDKVAIIDAETDISYTYAEFDARATAFAMQLLKMGFKKGDFFATSLPFLVEHIFLEYACFKIGVIHAPLDLRLKGPEVIRSLGLIQAKGYCFLGKTPVADFGELGKAVMENCKYIEHFIQFAPADECIYNATSAFVIAEEAKDSAADPELQKAYAAAHGAVDENDGAQVIYTTGSTGFPKPALLSHRNITCQNMCLGAAFGIVDDAKMLVNLPPSHVGGQAEQLMTPFFFGGTCVVIYIFDPEKTLRAIEKYQVDSFGQIPALFAMEWRLPNYKDFDLSSLRFALYGGQQVSRQFLEQLSQMAPQFGTGLGLTEMAGFCTYSPLDGTVDDILAGVGYDMPVTPLTIRKPIQEDGRAGEELPDGEAGEICFAGPQVFIAYVNNEEAYRKTVSTDGVCYTGDLGYKDEKGLHFSGRSKLVIKPKGYQIHPAQVEQHFMDMEDKVSACGCVGVAHEVFTEGIVCFVEKKPGASLSIEDLQAHAKDIAAYMRPSLYIILENGTFPLNRVAKTDYVVLKDTAKDAVETARKTGGWDAA
ncbi:MAG: acyl--CoA ligase [Deltaproteobacteria bacterium]|nr:acyl--CoA ligase [bacterium]MCB9475722.1 acyl--CoA ligase [Deltaproteobacteria bacterium]MCB9479244.1 acyl--CoA ligase [Deltaproteobacteria bacterium]MCB9490124.1 acyl--CoA ligase [Deltaproteobacteria bacterium]